MPSLWPVECNVPKDAIFSPCRQYRYVLWRKWDESLAPLAFVMLNPSKADAEIDDKTIKMCRLFAEREHAGGIIAVNLFSFVSTDWRGLLNTSDPVGPENTKWIDLVCRKASKIVVAWGTKPMFHEKIVAMSQFLSTLGAPVYCLGRTKDGSPKHPSRLAATTPLILYS